MNICIAGGNGFIGRGLSERLVARGDEVTWLSHSVGRIAPPKGVHEVAFNPADQSGDWALAVGSADAIVNLSGYPIASRWNPQVKELLRSSRIDTSRALVDAIGRAQALGKGPKVYVGASGIGIYGDRGDETLTESTSPGDDWLAQLARDWESEGLRAAEFGCRAVAMRTGLVLGSEGLVPRLVLPMKLFAGGPVGNGRQWMAWVHHDDIVGLYIEAIDNPLLSGPVNACAPNPVSSRDFSAALGAAMHRPSWFPVPGFALRIVLGEVAPFTLFSQRAIPGAATNAGYRFAFPDIRTAMEDVVAHLN